jgi:hypothetical protein
MMANKNVEGKKMPKIKMALEHFNGFVMLTCTSVYLTVGMAINMWHPTWVIFIVGVAICFIFGVIFDVNSK